MKIKFGLSVLIFVLAPIVSASMVFAMNSSCEESDEIIRAKDQEIANLKAMIKKMSIWDESLPRSCKGAGPAFVIGEQCKTFRGASFELVKEGWKDKENGGVVWTEFIDNITPIQKIDAASAEIFCKKKGFDLPTIEELETAFSHGFQDFRYEHKWVYAYRKANSAGPENLVLYRLGFGGGICDKNDSLYSYCVETATAQCVKR